MRVESNGVDHGSRASASLVKASRFNSLELDVPSLINLWLVGSSVNL